MEKKSNKNIGICADHAGFELKEKVLSYLRENKIQFMDFGAKKIDHTDDYPDYVLPLAKAVASGRVSHGIAICGSGVGACIAANKIPGVRAALITEYFSARQGVEDDAMNLICLGGRVIGEETAKYLITTFLEASFIGAERHIRRLQKIRR